MYIRQSSSEFTALVSQLKLVAGYLNQVF